MSNYSEDSDNRNENDSHKRNNLDSRSGRVFAGTILVIVGAVFLANRLGANLPEWLFGWWTFMIALGLFIGARRSFRGFGWIVPILIGGFFLIDHIVPELSFHDYIWPVAIILFGLVMILRPRHKKKFDWTMEDTTNGEMDITSIFGGTKKNVITKEFRGGDITTFFGGTDLNLSQADFTGTVVIDVTQVFGGTKLIVPPHWNIKSEVVCIFGAIEDKRPQTKEATDPTKILRLQGTCIFGGIEFKSY